jgi:signal transduction histidine kinase
VTRARSGAWWGFAATALVLVGVVTWLTVALLRLDRDEVQARRQAQWQERLRLALWRMDSWLAPQLAREAMRPADEYRSFPSAPLAWTRGLAKLEADAIVVQSPLVTEDSPLFPLHFELGRDGVTSPQVPRGNERDLCEANGVDRARLDRAAALLARFGEGLPVTELEQKLGGAEELLPTMGCNPISPLDPVVQQQGVNEYSNRQRSIANTQMPIQTRDGNANDFLRGRDGVGPLLPVWLDRDGGQLVFVRRVRAAGSARIQGVLVDWTQLQRELTALVEDLFPAHGVLLTRCEEPAPSEQPSMLASVPARLHAPCHDELASGLPLPAILGTTWGVTLLGLLVLGFTLRAAIGYGERRARFASAVTHELRTPLTTFRMYSEMLADGMVTDPAAQRDYLTTLQRESDRLARVVENVLAWSRLEEGRFTARRARHEVGPLLDRVVPVLQRRLHEAGMVLDVQVDDAARAAVVTTDDDAVGQILFNLVDNAAKYARDASDRRVELRARQADGAVELIVRDHGPGVPAALHARVFAPFDRGAVAASSNEVPGVGLGLALARGLARDLGGDLRLAAAPAGDGGASFVLTLPRG